MNWYQRTNNVLLTNLLIFKQAISTHKSLVVRGRQDKMVHSRPVQAQPNLHVQLARGSACCTSDSTATQEAMVVSSNLPTAQSLCSPETEVCQ